MNDNALLNSEAAKQILDARARTLAKEKIELITIKGSQILVFNLGVEQKYAIEYDVLNKVILDQKITHVPGVNPLFAGLLYYNAEIWPVINLYQLFNCPKTDQISNFILLYDGANRYALTAGTIIGQQAYDKSDFLAQLSAEKNDPKNNYILGIYDNDIALLNISTILNLIQTIPLVKNK